MYKLTNLNIFPTFKGVLGLLLIALRELLMASLGEQYGISDRTPVNSVQGKLLPTMLLLLPRLTPLLITQGRLAKEQLKSLMLQNLYNSLHTLRAFEYSFISTFVLSYMRQLG